MPLITDVKPQAKRQGYYNIFIDGKYALALSEADLSLFSLLPNQSIDDSTLADLHRAHSGSKCYNCAIRFLAIRPRSTTEVIAYLTTRKGYDAQDAKSACDKLTQQGYLDDIEFADMWVRNRMLLSPKPVSVLRMELASKGVDKDTIAAAVAKVSDAKQLECLSQLVESKARQPKYQNKQKLIEYLARKGYPYGLIKQAIQASVFFED
ncbi:MAG: RecX family transcriptional regulator [Patescibacteria group bacterium]|nr:RecX family transcriptional regulator [Patescibacteria group bacterium]